MLFDSGIIKFYDLSEIQERGKMPKQSLSFVTSAYYGERTIGYNRYYARLGANQQIDMLVRIWENRRIKIGMVAIIQNEQYRISNIQHIIADDGLRATDISLERLGDFYDVIN